MLWMSSWEAYHWKVGLQQRISIIFKKAGVLFCLLECKLNIVNTQKADEADDVM